MTATLTIRNLHAGYGSQRILHGIDLHLPAGASLAVIGPNGSGKSTLLKTIAGVVPTTAGEIWLGDVRLSELDCAARAHLGVAYVAQEHNVFAQLSVEENLRLSWEFMRADRVSPWHERRDAMLALFPELRAHLLRRAGYLSGGARQMLAMACALIHPAQILLLDEPSAGLSPKNAKGLYAIVTRILATGVTVLLVEQNIRLGLSSVSEGLLLLAGKERLRCCASELLERSDLHQLYLGAA